MFQLSIEAGNILDRKKQCGSTMMNLEVKPELTKACATSRCKQCYGGFQISKLYNF